MGVEFVEGSGFYPPTFNSFNANSTNTDVSIGNETVITTLTTSERVELSSLSLFHRMTSSNSAAGIYTCTLKISRSTVSIYVFSAMSSGVGTYLDTLIQNTTIILDKGDTISLTITGSSLAGGQGVHTVSLTAFGKYIL